MAFLIRPIKMINRNALFRRWLYDKSTPDYQTISKSLKEPHEKSNIGKLAEDTIFVPQDGQKHLPCLKRPTEDRISIVPSFWSKCLFGPDYLPCTYRFQSEHKQLYVGVEEAIRSIFVPCEIDIRSCQKDYLKFVKQLQINDENFIIPRVRVADEITGVQLYHIKLFFEMDLIVFHGIGYCLENIHIGGKSNRTSLFLSKVKSDGCIAMAAYLKMKSNMVNKSYKDIMKYDAFLFTNRILKSYLTDVIRKRLLFDVDAEIKYCCFYKRLTKEFLDSVLEVDYHNVI